MRPDLEDPKRHCFLCFRGGFGGSSSICFWGILHRPPPLPHTLKALYRGGQKEEEEEEEAEEENEEEVREEKEEEEKEDKKKKRRR